jgi:hypothetical protein
MTSPNQAHRHDCESAVFSSNRPAHQQHLKSDSSVGKAQQESAAGNRQISQIDANLVSSASHMISLRKIAPSAATLLEISNLNFEIATPNPKSAPRPRCSREAQFGWDRPRQLRSGRQAVYGDDFGNRRKRPARSVGDR